MKVAITGSSGLIGTALVASLRHDGHQVIRLVRRPPRSADEERWDPRAADAGISPASATAPGPLAGLDACVHLAGAGVASRRWTSRYKAEIRASRDDWKAQAERLSLAGPIIAPGPVATPEASEPRQSWLRWWFGWRTAG